MSTFEVKILEPSGVILDIGTVSGDNSSHIEILHKNVVEIETIASDSSSNIEITESNHIIEITDQIQRALNTEDTQDLIASFLSGNNGIILYYDDNNNSLIIGTSGLQPSGNYSIIGHTHTTSEITDFNSGVSGLLPVKNISSGSGISISSSSGDFTVSVTGTFGLTSEQVDDRVNDLLIAGNYISLNYNDLANTLTVGVTGLQPSGDYSLNGHTHTSSNITDFSSGVSGLLPSVSGIGYAVTSFNNNVYTISVTGVQPSGNYSVFGHSHTSTDITDFNSAVSGLIPPSNFTSLSGISGITVTTSGTYYTISLTDPSVELLDITDLSSDARTFLLSPSSSNLQTLITNETGSGLLVFNTSPALSGTPTVPTAPSGTNNTQIANTAFVRTEISNLVNSAPSTLDTLNELATALNNDSNFATTVTNSLSQKANLSGANFSGTVTAPSGDFGILSQSGVLVSVSGHTHSSSDIINFNNVVSGLLPSVIGSGYIVSSFNNNIYTLSATGLQPSGNYSIVGHSHTSSNITDFNSSVSGLLPVKNITAGSGIGVSSTNGDFTVSVTGTFGLTSEEVDDRVSNLLVNGSYINLNYNDNANTLTISATGLQPSGNYSIVGHNHPVSDITNFNTEVSGLLPSINGSGYISAIFNNNTYTIVATGLQPSGNYSIVGHSHNSSDIIDFNDGVSGLLPVKDIIAGSGIGVSSNSGTFTVSVTGSFGLTSEEVDDRVSNLLVGGNYINLNYDDNLNTLSISATGLQPSGNYSIVGHTHIISEVSGLQNALDSKQPSGIYASGIHTHLYSDITDFNNGVSGLLPSISGSGYVNSSFVNNNYTISVTGLQPSGNYSLVGHNHNASDIIDFNSTVSGLLPVKNILSGTGISVSSTSGIYTINSTGSGVLADQAAALVTTVFNKTGSPIPKMSAVYINGGQGDLPTVSLAIATSDMTSAGTYGLTYETISNMQSGKVIVFGALTGLDTDQFNPTAPHGNINGTVLYLSPYVSGALTVSKPSAPNHIVAIGTVVRTHQNEGIIEVRVQNGFELEELHNVAISGVTNGQFLQYNSGSGLWVPSSSGNFTSLSVNSTGVSLDGHSHISSNITDFNSSVSGLLPITNIVGGSNISVTPSGTTFTVSVTGSLGLTTEEVDDRVAQLLIAGSGISLSYNDNANTLTISTIKNTVLSDTVGSTNYIGVAPSGSSTSSNVWTIKRTIYNNDGTVSSNLTATNVAWTNRLTETYT